MNQLWFFTPFAWNKCICMYMGKRSLKEEGVVCCNLQSMHLTLSSGSFIYWSVCVCVLTDWRRRCRARNHEMKDAKVLLHTTSCYTTWKTRPKKGLVFIHESLEMHFFRFITLSIYCWLDFDVIFFFFHGTIITPWRLLWRLVVALLLLLQKKIFLHLNVNVGGRKIDLPASNFYLLVRVLHDERTKLSAGGDDSIPGESEVSDWSEARWTIFGDPVEKKHKNKVHRLSTI